MRWGLIDKIPTRPNYSRQVYSKQPACRPDRVGSVVLMMKEEETCFVWCYTCRKSAIPV